MKSLTLAVEALDNGDNDLARQIAMEILRITPDNLQAWLILSQAAGSENESDNYLRRAQCLLNTEEQKRLGFLERKINRENLMFENSLNSGNYKIGTSLTHKGHLSDAEPHNHINKKPDNFRSLVILDRQLPADSWINRWLIPIFYLLGISTAEVLTTIVEPRIGITAHALIFFGLLFHGSKTTNIHLKRFLTVLALVPLIRILSLSLPLTGRPILEWYFAVGILLCMGVLLAIRVTGYSATRIGFTFKNWHQQILIGLLGLGIGVSEYFILQPKALVSEFNLQSVLLPGLILLVFTGFVEEIIFRGLIQQAVLDFSGRFGLVYVSMLFSVMHVGYGSMLDIVYVFAVGLLFSLIVYRTGSLLGVSLAHGITNIGLYLVYPFLFERLALT